MLNQSVMEQLIKNSIKFKLRNSNEKINKETANNFSHFQLIHTATIEYSTSCVCFNRTNNFIQRVWVGECNKISQLKIQTF